MRTEHDVVLGRYGKAWKWRRAVGLEILMAALYLLKPVLRHLAASRFSTRRTKASPCLFYRLEILNEEAARNLGFDLTNASSRFINQKRSVLESSYRR